MNFIFGQWYLCWNHQAAHFIRRALRLPQRLISYRFPQDYPTSPFFLRLISPRVIYLTGHVTVGGSICIEALTLSGSPSSWQPNFTLESMLATALHNMMNCEVVSVQTATGPGGRSGPLAIDVRKGRGVVTPYSLQEATEAFQRTLRGHGWDNGAKTATKAQPASAANLAPKNANLGGPSSSSGKQQVPAPAKTPTPTASNKPSTSKGNTAVSGQSAHFKDGNDPQSQGSQSQGSWIKSYILDLNQIESEDEDDFAYSQGFSTVRNPPTLEERLAAANSITGLHLLPPPPHWTVTDGLLMGNTVFVHLPLPSEHPNASKNDKSRASASAHSTKDLQLLQANGLTIQESRTALDAAGGDIQRAIQDLLSRQALDEDTKIREIILNGFSLDDAEAALSAVDGNLSEALTFCRDCSMQGISPMTAVYGTDNRAHRKGRSLLRDAGSTSDTAQSQVSKEQEAMLKEVKEVLHRFGSTGVDSKRVIRVERVQNLERWSEYQRCKARLSRATQGKVNEQRLFHGTDKHKLATICFEGFDIRVSNLGGSYGAGIYFAQHSSYSDGYSRRSTMTPNTRHDSPAFIPDGFAMLLCDVALGKTSNRAHPHMRRPPDGHHSAGGGGIWAVFDNGQSYPAYCIHYK